MYSAESEWNEFVSHTKLIRFTTKLIRFTQIYSAVQDQSETNFQKRLLNKGFETFPQALFSKNRDVGLRMSWGIR